jgi:hypothetical protein
MQPAKKHDRSTGPTGEWLDWCQTKERIGLQLRNYYRACTPEELPPRLLALIKKLDEKIPARLAEPPIAAADKDGG